MNNSSNKLLRGDSAYNGGDSYSFIRYGVVKAIESDNGAKDTGLGRIKVYIKGPVSSGGDGDKPDESLDNNAINELPWCFPMLPKHLSIQPKIGEVVWIFTLGKNHQHADRLYIGPIISQLQLLAKDPFQYSALAGFTFGPQKPNLNPRQVSEINGVFPDEKDVTIQGRYNTDIIQKSNELLLRAGKFKVSTPNNNNPFPFSFNGKNIGYIQIKNDVVIAPKTDNSDEKRGTVTNIVANKINLITHEGGSPRFNVSNQDNLISDEELQLILSKSHQVPFGDVLLAYLRLMKDAILLHVHNGSGNPATDLTISGNNQAVAAFKAKADDLEKAMLSHNIRVN